MPDYIPSALPKFTDWVGLQTRKRPDYAAALGLTPQDVQDRAAADAAVLLANTEAADALRTSAAKVAARDEAIRVYNTQARLDIARAKTAPGYTEAIGKDCQWLTTTDAIDPTTLRPTLEIRDSAEGLVLKWSKDGQDGVQVYRRAAGAQDWGRPLAFDSRSPYIDTEINLVGRYEYYVQLMKDDRPVGQPSDIVAAMHGGR
ncbi:hypothetical protein [Hymenobacter terrenus]|uniref:hypothetical protein n=1 Tax=Hymenobacter terrenus TaxID=1629124 RepID=UPI000619E49C|nr:hypothetical protein [Hymenobacter terrenus]